MLASTLLAFRDLFLPRRCLNCREPLAGGWPRSVCDVCLESFEALSFEGQPVCPRCAIPTGPTHVGAADTRCGQCRTPRPRFDGARSFGRYDGRLRDAILRFKFSPEPPLARPLGQLAARAAAKLGPVDLVVPVPLHPEKLRDRGFNQAAFLAREVAERLSLPFAPSVLRRRIATAPQIGATRAARAENVRASMHTTADSVAQGRRVLLVDDVMTTGATADACARALLAGGARSVQVVTVARATLGQS